MKRYHSATCRHEVIEPLEKRAMLAAAQVTWNDMGGVLQISGDSQVATNDIITITVSQDGKWIVVTGGEAFDGQAAGAEPSECTGIFFSGAGGDDSLDMTAVNATNGFQSSKLDGKIHVDGEDGKDSINGSDFNDFIQGGNDALLTDRLFGNGGNDTIHGEGGPDHLEGGDGTDSILGGDGNDTMYGGGHNDTLWGSGGDDSMYGSWGCDSLLGGLGTDTGLGEYGDDSFDSLVENITGGTGRDSVGGQVLSGDASAPFDGCGDPNAGGGGFMMSEPTNEFEYLRNAFFLQLSEDRYSALAAAVDSCGCHSYEPDWLFESLASSPGESRARILGRLGLGEVDRAELLMILELAANRRP